MDKEHLEETFRRFAAHRQRIATMHAETKASLVTSRAQIFAELGTPIAQERREKLQCVLAVVNDQLEIMVLEDMERLSL